MTSTARKLLAGVFAVMLIASAVGIAQNVVQGNLTAVQPSQSIYYQTPIHATAAVNNQVTLTIPAPSAGLYNYVCKLLFTASQDGTATAINNSVTTSTNFNSFAFAFSGEDVAQKETIRWFDFGTPATGCAKSTTAATATTFVSPTAVANAGFAFEASYYQAP